MNINYNMNKTIKYDGFKPYQIMAIEIKANNYGITNEKLANEVGVCVATIRTWFNNPAILGSCLQRHRELNDGKAIELKDSLYREGTLGNVNAAVKWLEMEGYFDRTLTIKHRQDSPAKLFKDHLARNIDNGEIQEAEIINDEINVNVKPLPPRDIKNDDPKKVSRTENKRIKQTYAKKKLNSDQMDRHFWRKRAKAVGIDMLPPGRPSKEKLRNWHNDIVKAEQKFANGIVSNIQKSPK